MRSDEIDRFFQLRALGTDSMTMAIHDRETGRLIGSCAFSQVDGENGSAMYHITIGEKDVWGRGYGTEATRLMLDHAFGSLGLHRIALTVFEFNERAIRAYRRCGFVVEGRARESIWRDGRWWDELAMSVLSSEWHERRRTSGPQAPSGRPYLFLYRCPHGSDQMRGCNQQKEGQFQKQIPYRLRTGNARTDAMASSQSTGRVSRDRCGLRSSEDQPQRQDDRHPPRAESRSDRRHRPSYRQGQCYTGTGSCAGILRRSRTFSRGTDCLRPPQPQSERTIQTSYSLWRSTPISSTTANRSTSSSPNTGSPR